MQAAFNTVKVFSATKARERDALGDRVTEFVRDFDGEIVDKVVTQSSDREFHCFTITLFGLRAKRRRTNGRARNQDNQGGQGRRSRRP